MLEDRNSILIFQYLKGAYRGEEGGELASSCLVLSWA